MHAAIDWWRGQSGKLCSFDLWLLFLCWIWIVVYFNLVKKTDRSQQGKKGQEGKISSPVFWAMSFFMMGIHMSMPNQKNSILEVLFLMHLSVPARYITDTNSPKLNSLTCSNGKICFVCWPSEFLISRWWCDGGKGFNELKYRCQNGISSEPHKGGLGNIK